MLEEALAAGAAGWGLVMAPSPLLQIRQMIGRQSSRDVAIGYWCVLLVGFALWLAYGVAMANLALIVPNAVAFGVGCLTIGVAMRYRRPPRTPSGRLGKGAERSQTPDS
jgi:hypothetical protein